MKNNFAHSNKYPHLIIVNIEKDLEIFGNIVRELFLMGEDFTDNQSIIERSLTHGFAVYLNKLQILRSNQAPF